jgi:hypothetical protein
MLGIVTLFKQTREKLQARRQAWELREEQTRKICLAILESRVDAVHAILGNGFVPNRGILNVAAAGDSTQIFSLIADAGSFSDDDFAIAVKANLNANKRTALYLGMSAVIRHHRGQLTRAGLLETYRAPKTASNAM